MFRLTKEINLNDTLNRQLLITGCLYGTFCFIHAAVNFVGAGNVRISFVFIQIKLKTNNK